MEEGTAGMKAQELDTIDKVRVDFYMLSTFGGCSIRDRADIKTVFLGKKGRLTNLLRPLGALSAKKRMREAKKINALKAEIEAWLDE